MALFQKLGPNILGVFAPGQGEVEGQVSLSLYNIAKLCDLHNNRALFHSVQSGVMKSKEDNSFLHNQSFIFTYLPAR